jgi:hypothetical protein
MLPEHQQQCVAGVWQADAGAVMTLFPMGMEQSNNRNITIKNKQI